MQIHGETMKAVTDFIFLGSKITADIDCSCEKKDSSSLGKNYEKPWEHTKNRDLLLPVNLCIVKAMALSRSRGWVRELDHKESWEPKNWCFWTVVLDKTLENPLNCKEIQPVHPKGNHSWIFFRKTNAEAEPQILWPPNGKTLQKRPWCWKTLKAWGKGEDRKHNCWVASTTWWTWVWASCGSWW